MILSLIPTAVANSAKSSESKAIINTARTNAVRRVDFCRVQMYLAFSKYVARNMQLTNVADTDKQKYYKLGTTNDG